MKTFTVHSIIEGGAIAQFARRMYHKGRLTDIGVQYKPSQRVAQAKEVLDGLNPKLTEEQQQKIFSGEATLKGASICDNPKCTQCKGLEPIHFSDKPDEFALNEISQMKLEKIETRLEESDSDYDREEYNPTLDEEIKKEKREKAVVEYDKKQERDAEFAKEIEQELKSDMKGYIKLGNKYKVSLKSLDEYAKAIRWSGESAKLGFSLMGRGDPLMASKALADRIEKHKKLFKQAKITYHGEDRKNVPKESRKLYELIEEWIADIYPDLSFKSRMKSDRAFVSVMSGREDFVEPRKEGED